MRFDNTEQQDGGTDADGAVNAVFDGRKDGDKDADQEDKDFQRVNSPELVECIGGRGKVENGVDDDGRKCCIRDVVKHSGKRINGQKDHNGGNHAGKRSSHSGFGLDSCTRERTGGRISSQKGAEQVGDADCHEFLRWVDGIIVNTTEGLGNCDVFNQQNNDRCG